KLNTREEYVAWEQRCDNFIESLKEQSRIKCPRLVCCSYIRCASIGFVTVIIVAWFAERLKNLAHSVESILSTDVSMADFTRNNWQKLNSATYYLCENDCVKKLEETELSSCELFYSSLTDAARLSKLGEYSDLYLKTDVLLLILLKYTCNFELLTDVDMDVDILFIERGGLSQYSNKTRWDERYTNIVRYKAMIAEPNFHNRSVFSENLIAIEMRKLEVKFDKPIYVDICILNISKCLYEFYHEYIAPLFRENCKVMYTNTDSLIYHIKCDDIYDIMKRNIY
ncbi:hypothetical protein ALC53_06228, partial [Atta colombica]